MKTKTKQKKCPPIFYFRFFFNHFSLSPLPLFRQMMDRAPEAPDTPVSPRRKAALEALKAMRKMKQQQQEQHFLEEGKGGATAIEGRGGGRAAAAAAEEEETAAAAAAAFPRRASSSASSPRLIAAVYPKGRFGEGGRGAEAEEEEEDGGTGGSDGDDGNDSASAAAAEAEAAAAATATLVTAAAASRTQLDWRAQAEALETAKRLFEQQRRTKKKSPSSNINNALTPLAVACAERILELPQQAVESTKRALNIHLERAVLASLDYALSAEHQSFVTEDFRSIIDRLSAPRPRA